MIHPTQTNPGLGNTAAGNWPALQNAIGDTFRSTEAAPIIGLFIGGLVALALLTATPARTQVKIRRAIRGKRR